MTIIHTIIISILVLLCGCTFFGNKNDEGIFFTDMIRYKKPNNEYLERRVIQGNIYFLQKKQEILNKKQQKMMSQNNGVPYNYLPGQQSMGLGAIPENFAAMPPEVVWQNQGFPDSGNYGNTPFPYMQQPQTEPLKDNESLFGFF